MKICHLATESGIPYSRLLLSVLYMYVLYLMATAETEAAGLPGGGMAFSTVAVICGVGMVGSCVGPELVDAIDATDATEDDAGDRGKAGEEGKDGIVGVAAAVGVETGSGGGDAVGVGSDMTSSMMVDE